MIKRIIPVLLLKDRGLVKTTRFKNPRYIGDPINAVKIFNDKCVDELILVDIEATRLKKEPDYEFISDIVSEAFMPIAYGGGIKDLHQIRRLLSIGIEKVVINHAGFSNPEMLVEAVKEFGSSSIVASVDIKSNFFNKPKVFVRNGSQNTKQEPLAYCLNLQALGVGELFLNFVDREGTYSGYDLPMIKQIVDTLDIPVIPCGGARHLDDVLELIKMNGITAAAAGSIFVFYGEERGVLINYPDEEDITREFFTNELQTK